MKWTIQEWEHFIKVNHDDKKALQEIFAAFHAKYYGLESSLLAFPLSKKARELSNTFIDLIPDILPLKGVFYEEF